MSDVLISIGSFLVYSFTVSPSVYLTSRPAMKLVPALDSNTEDLTVTSNVCFLIALQIIHKSVSKSV